MHEKPNSRWQLRPSVASQRLSRSPGGPPAAATIGVAGPRGGVEDADQLALGEPASLTSKTSN